MLQHGIQYYEDSARYYQALADLNLPVLLDSQGSARYDIISAAPFQWLTAYRNRTILHDYTGASQLSHQDPLVLLEQLLGSPSQTLPGVPFCGGTIGLLSYDFSLPADSTREYDCPDLLIGFYDWALVVDHYSKKAGLYSTQKHASTIAIWPELIERLSKLSEPEVLAFEASRPMSNLPRSLYQARFDSIKAYIAGGDCYQVNLAHRLEFDFKGSGFAAYQKLKKASKAQFGAYIKTPDFELLSFSPERFLKLDYPWVETRPIKGTRARSSDPLKDQALKEALQNSEKDRAENLMIVDLLRNDLSKVCEAFSVEVPELFAVESFAAVHHLLSTVKGKLKPHVSPAALLQACFPGGSITGAPKIRAMEIIKELEPNSRGPYCGSVFYIGWDWKMDSNIAIRTLLREKNKLYCWAGGGIVQDSDRESEYQESWDKISLIIQGLGQGLPRTAKLS